MQPVNQDAQKANMNSAKVAVVCPDYGLVGGAEMFAFELTERLAEHTEFNFHVFANKWRAGTFVSAYHKIPIIRFPRWLRPVSFAWFANQAIKKGSFDLVHGHTWLYAFDFLTHHGLPHATWIEKVRQKRPSLFDRAVSRIESKGILNERQPHVMPVSSMGKVELQKAFNLPENRLQVIHPGISVQRYLEKDRDLCRTEIRQRHALAPEDVVALFVGMNFPLKGLDRIMHSIAEFTRQGREHTALKLLVVGKGDVNKYTHIAKELGIADRVVFAGERSAVESYFLASDFFVLMSHMDLFGIVVLEAMASGLPVIISDTVGAKDVIDTGGNGYIIENANYDREMQTALKAMMQPDQRNIMGTAAKQVAVQYDWENVAGQVAGLYRQRLIDQQTGVWHR
jgi:UDP-glucose:(heptosyl)LPS alpha-1,3-glucosyltransferase